jgi:hypothetical protein
MTLKHAPQLLALLASLAVAGASGAAEKPVAEAPAKPIRVTFDELAPGPYTQQAATAEWPVLKWFGLAERGRIVASAKNPAQRFLEVTYPAGTFGPDKNGGQFLVAIPAREEWYLDYYVMFRPGFDFRLGGKLPGLTGNGALSTGGNNHPGEAWSARYMWHARGGIGVYLYHMDQKGKYGDTLTLEGCTLKPGQWHRLTQRLKVNTNEDRNGVVQVWFDGKKVVDRTDLRLRSGTKAPVDSFYFSTFHGGSSADWAPQSDSLACFDDFLIASSEREALNPARKPPE